MKLLGSPSTKELPMHSPWQRCKFMSEIFSSAMHRGRIWKEMGFEWRQKGWKETSKSHRICATFNGFIKAHIVKLFLLQPLLQRKNMTWTIFLYSAAIDVPSGLYGLFCLCIMLCWDKKGCHGEFCYCVPISFAILHIPYMATLLAGNKENWIWNI